MMSTFPSHRAKSAAVFLGVSPTTEPSRSLGCFSSHEPSVRKPTPLRMRPYSLATVVFPVPGLPRNTRLREPTEKGDSPRTSRS
eukprot:6065193-Pleurochrysis_carterae.AAC.2